MTLASAKAWRYPILLGVYLLGFAAQTFLTKELFTDRFPGGNDLYPRWEGGCGRLRGFGSPYAQETTLRIQRGLYGRPALPDEDQAAYAYPLYTLFFTSPLCLTQDFALARAAWITASIHLLLLGTVLARGMAGWRAPGWLWAVTLFWSVLVYPNARALILGQLSVLVFAFVIASLVLVVHARDVWGGAVLAAATIKPQMMVLIAPWLLWWGVWRGRRGVVYGFGSGILALTVAASLLQPAWLGEFVSQLRTYTGYTEFGSVTWILTTYYLGTPPAVEWLITVGWLMWLGFEWWRGRRAGQERMLWLASLTLVITHFVAPRTATTHFAPLVLPLFLIFRAWRNSGWRYSNPAIAAVLALSLIGTWGLFLTTVEGIQESALNYIPIPVLLLVGLYAVRSQLGQSWETES